MVRKHRVKIYLSKREKAGSILFLVICYAYTLYRLYHVSSMEINTSVNAEQFFGEVEKIKKDISSSLAQHEISDNKKPDAVVWNLASFDPNKVSKHDLTKMGIPKYVATAIVNYRAAGAEYLTKKDLKKVYGMTHELFQRISPYVHIEEQWKEKTRPEKNFSYTINTVHYYELVNHARIPGKLANRILSYRHLLGGYSNLEQVREVYGMTDSMYLVIMDRYTINVHDSIQSININTAEFRQFLRHPYISKSIARAMIAYRTMHGSFDSIEQVKEIHLITDSIYSKLAPYLSVNDTIRGSKKAHSQRGGFSQARDTI